MEILCTFLLQFSPWHSPDNDWGPGHVNVRDNLRRDIMCTETCVTCVTLMRAHHSCCPDIVCCDGPVEEGDDDLLRDIGGDGGHPGHSYHHHYHYHNHHLVTVEVVNEVLGGAGLGANPCPNLR